MKCLKSSFGVDLIPLIKATTPVVLEKCINEIESRPYALDTEGLYRIAKFFDTVEEIKLAFERNCDHIDLFQEYYPDIHAITCVLKLYLRQLPMPLVIFDIYTQLLEFRPSSICVTAIHPIIHCLRPAHFHTLKYVCEHLLKFSHYLICNQMTIENLAILSTPTIMRLEKIECNTSISAKESFNVVESIIESIIPFHDNILIILKQNILISDLDK
jgi:hypothetical protein